MDDAVTPSGESGIADRAAPAPREWVAVCFPRYTGADGVEEFCRELVEQEGVLLLPASIYRSDLVEVPSDRFRIGVGRRDPSPALEVFDRFLERKRRGG